MFLQITALVNHTSNLDIIMTFQTSSKIFDNAVDIEFLKHQRESYGSFCIRVK